MTFSKSLPIGVEQFDPILNWIMKIIILSKYTSKTEPNWAGKVPELFLGID